jgi:hypothetical protein
VIAVTNAITKILSEQTAEISPFWHKDNSFIETMETIKSVK